MNIKVRYSGIFLFPARAGVIPDTEQPLHCHTAIPRTRGGDPALSIPVFRKHPYSPHARG